MRAKSAIEKKSETLPRKHKPRTLLTEEVSYQVIGIGKKDGLEHVLCSVKTADAAAGSFELGEKHLSDKFESFFIRKAAIMTRNNGQA